MRQKSSSEARAGKFLYGLVYAGLDVCHLVEGWSRGCVPSDRGSEGARSSEEAARAASVIRASAPLASSTPSKDGFSLALPLPSVSHTSQFSGTLRFIKGTSVHQARRTPSSYIHLYGI